MAPTAELGLPKAWDPVGPEASMPRGTEAISRRESQSGAMRCSGIFFSSLGGRIAAFSQHPHLARLQPGR